MKIEFWGTRGSVPSAHRDTAKYGGNTACVEIRTRSNDLIILDAGTGIRRLGAKIMQTAEPMDVLEETVEFIVENVMNDLNLQKAEGLRALEGSSPYKKEMNIFLSHNHWDHIQGYPFFIPAYMPGYKLNIHSLLKADHRLKDIFDGQMSRTYFPVMLKDMGAERNFIEIVEDTIRINDTLVTSRHLNHPQGCLGYRVQCGEMVVTYCTDNEHPETGLNPNILELAENADVFIYDSQYTPEEYPMKKNWGHSTWKVGIQAALEAGAKWFVMFHHDPAHDDAFMDQMLAEAQKEFPNALAAYEGMTITDYPTEPTESPDEDTGEEDAALVEPSIQTSGNDILVRPGATLLALANPAFRARFGAAIDTGARNLIVDCSGLAYTSRHGFIALADLSGEAKKEKGVHLTLKNMSPSIERLARITRFDAVAKFE